MNYKAAVSISTGIICLVATVAQLNGHVESTAFYQILGSVVAVLVLAPIIASFE